MLCLCVLGPTKVKAVLEESCKAISSSGRQLEYTAAVPDCAVFRMGRPQTLVPKPSILPCYLRNRADCACTSDYDIIAHNMIAACAPSQQQVSCGVFTWAFADITFPVTFAAIHIHYMLHPRASFQ